MKGILENNPFIEPQNSNLWKTCKYWSSFGSHCTVAQKTAPMFAYYMKTHVLLNADII